MAVIVWALKNWKIVAAGLAMFALLLAGGWLYQRGRADEQARQDKASLTNLRDRSAIDDAVRTDDDVALCMRLHRGTECRSLQQQR